MAMDDLLKIAYLPGVTPLAYAEVLDFIVEALSRAQIEMEYKQTIIEAKRWAEIAKLSFSPATSVAMQFKGKLPGTAPILVIDGFLLPFRDSVKCLGFI